MLRLYLFMIFFLSSYCFGACLFCDDELPEEISLKMKGLMGKIYHGTLELPRNVYKGTLEPPNGEKGSFQFYVERDNIGFSSVSSSKFGSFFLFRSAFASSCVVPGFSIKGYFLKGSQLVPDAKFTGYYGYYGLTTELKIYVEQNETSKPSFVFTITLDMKFTFSEGAYGNGDVGGKILSFAQKE